MFSMKQASAALDALHSDPQIGQAMNISFASTYRTYLSANSIT